MYKRYFTLPLVLVITVVLIISSYAGGINNQKADYTTPSEDISVASETSYLEPETTKPEEVIESETQSSESETVQEEIFIPKAIELNLTHVYPEGTDNSDPLSSYAAIVYKQIFEHDEQWYDDMSNVFDSKPLKMANRLGYGQGRVTGKYDITDSEQFPNDPNSWIIKKWTSPTIQISNADGKSVMSSNAKEILAMANVYAYYHDWTDHDAVLEYALNLWKRSHKYSISMGQVYYCDGCITDERASKAISQGNGALAETQGESESDTANDESEENTGENSTDISLETSTDISLDTSTETQGDTLDESNNEASPSDASAGTTDNTNPAQIEYPDCPGHITITVHAKIYDLNSNNSLFDRDDIGNDTANFNDNWNGWTEERKNSARILAAMDWYELYGLSISSFSERVILTEEEIQGYLNELPEDLSDERRSLIEYGLRSVGNVPYYWGGKPDGADYEVNDFYSVVSPDYKGRIFRGLDCSGWINWVYWSVTGERPTAEGTAGLVGCGSPISRKSLTPGDIIVRPGDDETIGHVIMFLKWADDGSIICIHETGGKINNVTIGNMSAYWNYRKLIE